ncbi:MAG: rhomboid family intramembrane serine protease [Sedimentisphaerales bacterium]|nr:rhomboid family intramembrane serine protease [Sedimentisphaerales bacterium]MBN2842525.1 rhomboid family intramembrane serine protease [Sedimentisphaerales bacterium]
MSFQDRNYYGGGQGGMGGPFGGGSRLSFGLPSWTPMVKLLIIINVVVFVIQHVLGPNLMALVPGELTICRNAVDAWFSVIGFKLIYAIQLWRIITFQFLHADMMHLLFNMLGLFFLGPVLERSWGSRHLLFFYLTCGAVGGMLYNIASLVGFLGFGTLVGASGGVLGLMVACAILFPQFQVILFIFPVPIRFACVLFTVMYVVNVLQQGRNAGGDLCHLGGMATGFAWIMWRPLWQKKVSAIKEGAFQAKQQEQVNLEYEVDRILAKVHSQGIHSLTSREKQILQQATENQKRNGR